MQILARKMPGQFGADPEPERITRCQNHNRPGLERDQIVKHR